MIVNAIAQWACLAKPNEMSGKFQVDLTQLDEKDVAQLAAAGVPVSFGKGKKEGYGNYITVKSERPVAVVTTTKTPFDAAKLGNGSKVKASVKPFEWNFKGKKGISAGLQALMVTEAKIYEPGGIGEFEAEAVEAPKEDDLGF